MNKHQLYETKTEELVLPLAEEFGFEFVDVEFLKEAGSYHLRVYMDKEGGITIDDLAKVNRALSTKMDEKDFIEEAYILEVSSPGLTRPLKKPKDFIRSIGKDVEVKLYQPVTWEENGKKYSDKEFVGILKEYREDEIVLQFDEDTMTVPLSNIALIRLSVDF